MYNFPCTGLKLGSIDKRRNRSFISCRSTLIALFALIAVSHVGEIHAFTCQDQTITLSLTVKDDAVFTASGCTFQNQVSITSAKLNLSKLPIMNRQSTFVGGVLVRYAPGIHHVSINNFPHPQMDIKRRPKLQFFDSICLHGSASMISRASVKHSNGFFTALFNSTLKWQAKVSRSKITVVNSIFGASAGVQLHLQSTSFNFTNNSFSGGVWVWCYGAQYRCVGSGEMEPSRNLILENVRVNFTKWSGSRTLAPQQRLSGAQFFLRGCYVERDVELIDASYGIIEVKECYLNSSLKLQNVESRSSIQLQDLGAPCAGKMNHNILLFNNSLVKTDVIILGALRSLPPPSSFFRRIEILHSVIAGELRVHQQSFNMTSLSSAIGKDPSAATSGNDFGVTLIAFFAAPNTLWCIDVFRSTLFGEFAAMVYVFTNSGVAISFSRTAASDFVFTNSCIAISFPRTPASQSCS